MMRRWLIPFVCLCAFHSCGNGTIKKDHVSHSDDNVNDSTCTHPGTSDPITGVQPTHLPDTTYPSASNIRYDIFIRDTLSDGCVDLRDDIYTHAPGVFTFRGSPYRDASFGGIIDGRPSEIRVDWKYETPYDTVSTSHGRWGGGTGWTGQPLIVHWPDSCMRILRGRKVIYPSASADEVIIGSLDRHIHFIDLHTGKDTRDPICVDNPIKGTPTLDPTLNGNLYAGHGVPATAEMGALVIDLYNNDISHFYGRDAKALRGWNAYDSSPIRTGQFLFRPGENGILYKYTVLPGSLILHSSMRYTVNGHAPGIEASMACWINYGYLADNAGNIICVNLDNLRPVWLYRLADDIDSTPVLAEEDGVMYLYTGCEVEHEGVTHAEFVKLDALTGKCIWKDRTEAFRHDEDTKHFDGGYYATSLPGAGNCSHLVFNNIVINNDNRNGNLTAFDRKSGRKVYSIPLKYYAWSSPVGLLDRDGRQYIVTADCAGRIYLIDGIDGKTISCKQVGANFESSPVVIDSSIVIGSRGTAIYKLTIR